MIKYRSLIDNNIAKYPHYRYNYFQLFSIEKMNTIIFIDLIPSLPNESINVFNRKSKSLNLFLWNPKRNAEKNKFISATKNRILKTDHIYK